MKTSVEIVTAPEAIAALRPGWDTLWARAGGTRILAATTCLVAWQRTLANGARLAVAVATEADRLVALWPLSLRRRGLWRVLNQAGPLANEFSNVLVEPGPEAERRVAALWSAVSRPSFADLAIVPYVRQSTPLGAVLASDPRAVLADPEVARSVVWREGETWDSYYRSLNKSYRRQQKSKRRLLSELGEVRFEVVKDRARIPGLIAWLMREKREWSDRTDKRAWWLSSADYETFLTVMATEPSAGAEYAVFLLSCGDEPVAAMLVMIGPQHTEWIIASFAAKHARYSAGNVLNEFAVRFAFERGLNVEYGFGSEKPKKFWANTTDRTFSYRIALNRWGVVGARSAQQTMRLRTRLQRARSGSDQAVPEHASEESLSSTEARDGADHHPHHRGGSR